MVDTLKKIKDLETFLDYHTLRLTKNKEDLVDTVE